MIDWLEQKFLPIGWGVVVVIWILQGLLHLPDDVHTFQQTFTKNHAAVVPTRPTR